MNALKLSKHVMAILCIGILFCAGCKKDRQRVYQLLPPDPEDVTAQGALSVNIENDGGRDANEGSTKVTDGDLETKFLIFEYDPSLFMQLKFRTAQHITSYTLTSANDAPGRDPKDWVLSGSNDGSTWKDLDVRSGETFASRGLTKSYEFANADSYTYYKLTVTANGGDDLFQLAEWRVTNVPL